ncbi:MULTISPECIES: DUF4230 domain-containing protein [Paenarthrobacter]|uniref:DUF4230 domain-containing protein n=1 Tax=Paenarthrobacter TaxID=1742992 RepID=UPI00076CA9FB|nr:DUF4230 domain-containing protein [Paenarthrobacter ureafaciens]KUR63715.1 hypothetical protein JM67_15730 [Arthrobacter sp. ATCC 21022]RWW99129.1 DUF4230 domain-containing protein [Paenarthrobacter ureafaciens]
MVKSVVMVLVSVIIGAIAVVGLSNLTGVSPFVSQRNDRSQPALLKSIKDISQYHAAVGNFETVVDIDDNVPGLPSAIAGRRTLFVAAGTVNAYVDLSSFADDDLKLSADGKSVTVRLPEAVLDKPNLDHDRSYVFSQDRGLIDRIADAMETPPQAEFFKLAETKLTSAAQESRLREQAVENTRTMLTGMFSSLGIQAIFR